MTRRLRTAILARQFADQRDEALRANRVWADHANGLSESLKSRPVSVNELHSTLQASCVPLFQQEHYEAALSDAAKCVEVRLREAIAVGSDVYGQQLVSKAFGGDTPLLVVSDIAAEQKACFFMFAGFFGFVRNPAMHNSLCSDNAKIYAFERISMASLLLRVIDEVKASGRF